MTLVTDAGWTISRIPIVPIGIDPLRVKASRRSASKAAKVRQCGWRMASIRASSSCCTRITEVTAAIWSACSGHRMSH